MPRTSDISQASVVTSGDISGISGGAGGRLKEQAGTTLWRWRLDGRKRTVGRMPRQKEPSDRLSSPTAMHTESLASALTVRALHHYIHCLPLCPFFLSNFFRNGLGRLDNKQQA